MGSARPRSLAPRLAPAGMALAAIALLVTLGSCGPATSSSRDTPSPVAPTPQPTGINPTEAAALVPLAPPSAKAEATPSGVRVTWSGTGQDDVHYLIHRKVLGAPDWTQLAMVAISGDNRGSYTFTDTTAERNKTTYVYGVGAVNASGRESAITQTDPVTLPTS